MATLTKQEMCTRELGKIKRSLRRYQEKCKAAEQENNTVELKYCRDMIKVWEEAFDRMFLIECGIKLEWD